MFILAGKDENVDSLNQTDRYFGTRIAGGYTKSGDKISKNGYSIYVSIYNTALSDQEVKALYNEEIVSK